MSDGRVVSTSSVQARHKCQPQWTKDADGRSVEHSQPAGTVWQCDCGKTWVSLGRGPHAHPGYVSMPCEWRPEGKFERWWREWRKR